ncbi:MAG TPA: pyruvate formate lyase family protein [Clostridia bacterium]|nr:pyruvate formate lyase family protein [Clostridia bacterium]
MNENIQYLLDFTEVYRKHMASPKALREIACLRVQFPRCFQRVQSKDLFAGRRSYGAVGVAPIYGHSGTNPVDRCGYYIDLNRVEADLQQSNITDPCLLKKINEAIDLWINEDTAFKLRNAYTEIQAKYMPHDIWNRNSGVIFPLYRIAGTHMDYGKLISLGIEGLKKEIYSRKCSLTAAEEAYIHEAMLEALDLFSAVCLHYAEQIDEQLSALASDARIKQLKEMKRILLRIREHKPESLREAIQLVWLYTLISGATDFGRMDCYLGDLYVNDIQSGRLSKEEAVTLLSSFWMLIDEELHRDARIILGGMGRSNPDNADLFALAAIEVTGKLKLLHPQPSLRCYEGMNECLFEAALDCLGEGTTYPVLYNDDVNVPSVESAFRIGSKEAEQYVFFGCGEYVIEHRSTGTPSGVINLLKALELTLHNGFDPVTGSMLGIQTGEIDSHTGFEELFSAYKLQLEHFIKIIGEQEALEYRIVGEDCTFLYLSMLYDNCIAEGKGLCSGGVKYLGGTLETYGSISTADSLTAIKTAVYDRKLWSLAKLIKMLDADFEGFEKERMLLLDAPKFGNDDDTADAMAQRVHDHVCGYTRELSKHIGLHSYLVVNINNSANTPLGFYTGASADGRKAGQYLSNGNAPTPGRDKNGITAVINSMVKLDTRFHAGASQNMKFSGRLFNEHRNELKQLLKTFFRLGGASCNISVINQKDLEAAIKDPEKYQNLIVRVGGFSARFVSLAEGIQKDILTRNIY